jgi:hypothetical protein
LVADRCPFTAEDIDLRLQCHSSFVVVHHFVDQFLGLEAEAIAKLDGKPENPPIQFVSGDHARSMPTDPAASLGDTPLLPLPY